jgi:antitoxin MazE
MNMIVKTKIVKIGNSRGIRIPKVLLDQVDFEEEVALEVQQGNILIRSLAAARAGWEEQFRFMAERHDDALLDGEDFILTEWDEADWNW